MKKLNKFTYPIAWVLYKVYGPIIAWIFKPAFAPLFKEMFETQNTLINAVNAFGEAIAELQVHNGIDKKEPPSDEEVDKKE